MGISTFTRGRTPATLRGLQMLSLTDRGYSRGRTIVSDDGGGGATSWTDGGTVQCRIDPIADRGGNGMRGGRVDERSTHVITAPSGVEVVADNQFVIVGRGTFEVTAARTRTDALTQVFEVIEAS